MFEQNKKEKSQAAVLKPSPRWEVWCGKGRLFALDLRFFVSIGVDASGVGKQLPCVTHFLDIRSRAPIVERGGLRLEQDVQVPSSQGTQSPSPIRAPRGDLSLLHLRM